MKKTLVFILVVCMSLSVCACSKVAESPAEDKSTTVLLKTDEWQSYDEEYTSEVIMFEMLDNTNAVLIERMIKSEDMYIDTTRNGTYKLNNLGYEFLSKEPYYENLYYFANIVPDQTTPGRIETITDGNVSYYEGTSEVFGDAQLEVVNNSDVTVRPVNGKIVIGELLDPDGSGYDFFANNEDYYVEFSGNTYTLKRYADILYESYAGTYTAQGVLGELTFVVNSDGRVGAEFLVDETNKQLSGTVNTDVEQEQIIGCQLYADNSASLSIDLIKLTNGKWFYYVTDLDGLEHLQVEVAEDTEENMVSRDFSKIAGRYTSRNDGYTLVIDTEGYITIDLVITGTMEGKANGIYKGVVPLTVVDAEYLDIMNLEFSPEDGRLVVTSSIDEDFPKGTEIIFDRKDGKSISTK